MSMSALNLFFFLAYRIKKSEFKAIEYCCTAKNKHLKWAVNLICHYLGDSIKYLQLKIHYKPLFTYEFSQLGTTELNDLNKILL